MNAGSAITTHVLDTARGEPAAGVTVRLESAGAGAPAEIGRGRTGPDGRCAGLGPPRLEPGLYRLVFDTGEYLAGRGEDGPQAGAPPGRGPAAAPFFPEVAVTFRVDGSGRHYHLPLLLSPFGYATYRGS